MKTEDVLNLFELIKNAPEENWGYNKSRLREILCDYEKEKRDAFVMNGICTDASIVTEKVIKALQIINNTNSLDEILFLPHVREKFKQGLVSQLQNI